MRPYHSMISSAALLLALASAAPAQAQSCPEGKTLSGECVNPVLSRVMRKQVVVATQPKFSYTAPLYLPSEGRFYTLGSDYREIRHFYGNPPCAFSVIC